MPDILNIIMILESLYQSIQVSNDELNKLENLNDFIEDKDIKERILEFTELKKNTKERIKKQLVSLLQEPPHHNRHFQKLPEFHSKCKYDNTVFIMTKFPINNKKVDKQLEKVISVVQESICKCKDSTGDNYIPRIASEKDYHNNLWDNVELYLLGSKKAVAIVEDKYLPELNPNVAMEWGWMRGMGKDILFLVEKDFKHFRADWSGLIKYEFGWANPKAKIEAAILNWLK